jgi:hypothetical protein
LSPKSQAIPANPIIDEDPATSIRPHVTFYEDQSFSIMNNKEQYLRAAGDLARVQGKMLLNKSNLKNYPEMLIGRGLFTGNCNLGSSTLGAYKKDCKIIQINFSDGNIYYESPIEVLTTMAHEYGHHLTEITIGLNKISGLESELIADCFAGLMYGYWDKNGNLTEEDIKSAVKMIIQVSKTEGMNTSDMHGDPGQRAGAFLAGALKAQGQNTVEYQNFCKRLDYIIDWSAGLP